MDQSLPAMFFDRAQSAPDMVHFRAKGDDGVFVDTTFGEVKQQVEALAAGFLDVTNLQPGDRVLIMSNTRPEWVVADYALLSLGVQTVPVYASLLAPEVGYIAQDTGAIYAVVEDKEQLQEIRDVEKGFTFFEKDYPAGAVKVQHCFVIDTTGIDPADDWTPLADIADKGAPLVDETADERERRLRAQQRKDLATFCYTSGTTGPPKGVLQTHDNVLSLLENVDDTGIFDVDAKDSGAFVFLPLAHSFGRLMQFGCAFYESVIVFSSMATLAEDLAKTKPGFLPGAPRMFEKIYTKVTSLVASQPPMRQRLFGWALDVGKRRIPYWQAKKPMPLFLGLQHKLADKMVWSKIRDRLGMDNMVAMLSGSAPLSLEVQEFFAALGVIILEAYGLTETSPGLTVNRLTNWKQGTVGSAIKGVELKLAADGEILAKGPNVTSGYLNREEATAEAFDDDGWFKTGDIGEFDDDGFLKITDRKKDLIKTSGGKYVAPQKIEGLFKAKPLITEAVVIGERRKYCVVLLSLDEEAHAMWQERTGASAALDDAQLLDELQTYVDDINGGLASFESLKYFRVMDEQLTIENGMMTASFKVKRKAVNARFAALIEEMYDVQPPQVAA